MNSVYTIVSGGPPYQVGPYEPGRWPYFFCGLHSFPSPVCDIVGDAQRASRYALRASRSVVVSLRLSRRYAASESAKKAVVRGSWFVKAHHHSEWAVVKYHSGPTFGTAPTNHKLIPHEPRATNYEQQKKHYPSSTYPAESRISLSGCILSHHQVTRFGISDSHGFARRKAPLLTMHYVYITFQAGRPSGRPLRATNH